MSLELQQLQVFLHDTRLLGLNARILPGQVLTVMGPSGSGKSTLLDVIMGVAATAFRFEGQVRLNGQSLNGVAPHKRRIGMLYQDPLLFEHLTVGENIAFAVPRNERKSQSRQVLRQTLMAKLENVGLGDMYDRPVQTLSGGQQARVALLRTLASRPQAVLLDEPFSKLDAARRTQTREWVFGELREQGIPALLVTHDGDDARAAGGNIIEV